MSEKSSCNPLEPTIDHTRPTDGAMIIPQALGYVLYERVGVGGMGEVYRCADDSLGRDLAIKVIRSELHGDAAAEERFLREARLTGSLQHPGIVPIHHLGRLADGRPYYTMKLIRGRTFADMLREEPDGPERLPRLLAVVEKVCQAVAFAHSRGVIHRDLKPANIMVGEFGEVQVMDWGLAKELSRSEPAMSVMPGTSAEEMETVARGEEAEGLSRAGAALGTPHFMSPEQAAGDWDIVDERADVFALGAILCQVLIGRPPYYGGNREDILRRARLGDVAEALECLRQSNIDEALVQVVRDCLAPQQQSRPRNAGVAAERLAAYEAAVQERLRQAELERVAAEAGAREAVARMAAERRAKRRLLGLAAAVLIFVIVAAVEVVERMRTVRAEQQKTQAAWKQTREALNTLTDDAMEELLAKQTVLSPKEKDFLRKALGFYEQFAAERGEDEEARAVAAGGQFRVAKVRAFLGETKDAELGFQNALRLYEKLADDFPAAPQYRQALARCHTNLGLLLQDLGKRPEAEAAYRQARTVQEKLVADFPDASQYRGDLATIGNDLGILLNNQGRDAEAKEVFNETRVLLEQLVREVPTNPEYRRDLAAIHHGLGKILGGARKFDDAAKAFRQAIAVQEKLVGDFPSVPRHRQYLAISYNSLGFLLRRMGKVAEAETAYRQAIAVQEKLVGDFPSVPRFRGNLALSCFNFANMLRVRKRPQAALDWYAKAMSLQRLILAQDPRAFRARQALCNAHVGRAKALAQLGRHAESVQDWLRAGEFDDGRMRSVIRIQQSLALARAGEPRAAVKTVEELLASSDANGKAPPSDSPLYDAACVCALASAAVKDDTKLREQYAARAVALLRQAHKDGLFKDPKQIDNMRKDTDLDSLRKREDFKNFLTELK